MKRSIDVQFGQAVKRLRVKLGVSQESLADRSKLHRTYISDVERGARNLSLHSIKSLADGLNIPLSRLFTEVERPSSDPIRDEFERCRLGGNRIITAAKAKSGDYASRLRKLYIRIEDLDGAVQSRRKV